MSTVTSISVLTGARIQHRGSVTWETIGKLLLPIFFNGSTLYNFCRDTNIAHQSACEGYILSINDNMFSNEYKNDYKVCYPKGVSPAQLRLQLVKYIENNPDYMNKPANTIVIQHLLFIGPTIATN